MAAQVVVSATDLASQATAPSHVLDSESLLSQPSVIVEAEPEAEPDEPDTFGDFETSDAPYVLPAFQVQSEPINDADKKKWKSHNAQRKKEKLHAEWTEEIFAPIQAQIDREVVRRALGLEPVR